MEDGPQSLLPYDRWTEHALLEVVVQALIHAGTEGLPGEHHFYLSFRTDHPACVIPARLRAQYPEEMTIVLQHQFDRLTVDRATRMIGVMLSFGGIASQLWIPLDAVTAFADPHVNFGLRFQPAMPEPKPVMPAPAEAGAAAVPVISAPEPSGDVPQVVSLDAFRRRKD